MPGLLAPLNRKTIMQYGLNEYVLYLDDLLATAAQHLLSYEVGPDHSRYACPSLAAVLAWGYRKPDLLVAIDAYEENWQLTTIRRPQEQHRLAIDIPVLVSRMYRLIVEDGQPPAAVVDLDVLREQLVEALRQAYQQKFGP
jgi:hypothetical protein